MRVFFAMNKTTGNLGLAPSPPRGQPNDLNPPKPENKRI